MLKPDLTYLRISTKNDAQTYPPVSVSRFERGEYHLYYVNARHVTNADNATCETIHKAFQRYRPKGVVVECGGDAAGAGFKGYVAYVLDHVESPSNAKNECDFTILKAISSGLPLANGEPTDEAVCREVLARGYSLKEFLAHQHLQWLGQAVRHKKIILATFDTVSHQILEHRAKVFGIPEDKRLSLEEYKTWFKREYPERKNWVDVSSADTAPENKSGATFAERLSYDIDRTREPYIVQTISNMLNAHKSVLVVYGTGHRESHLAVFENMLGPCKLDILVPETRASERRGSFNPKSGLT